ncbi:MAG TPA: hypothetical protein VFV70_09915 [Hyphomonadaceae bacterium]|nr:hypothetical protein [Hyphomonadaceae bacterium]
MAVGEAGPDRLKAAAPYIGVGALIAIVVGVGAALNSGKEGTAPSSGAAPVETPVRETAPADTPGASTDPQAQSGTAIPGVAQAPAAVTRPGAGAAQMDMEIVVKFKDDAKVKDIIDAFWKDQASARAKFDALKARRPEFADLTLDRVTYSNELVLVHEDDAPAAQRLPAMRGIAAKLKDVSDISYAEPNMTAHPGGQ